MSTENVEPVEYRIILKSGAAFTIKAVNIQFSQEDRLDVFIDRATKNQDIFIQASEVAAIVPVEFLSVEKQSSTS